MKRNLLLMFFIAVVSASPSLVVSEENAKVDALPKGLIGTWSFEKKIFVIQEKVVSFDENNGGTKYAGNIIQFDKDKGFVAVEIASASSQGFDHTTGMKGNLFIFYFRSLTDASVDIATPAGSGAISKKYMTAYHDGTKLYEKYTLKK